MTFTSFFSGLLHLFSQKNNPSGLWGFSRNARWKTNPILKDETEKIAVSIYDADADTIRSFHSRCLAGVATTANSAMAGIPVGSNDP